MILFVLMNLAIADSVSPDRPTASMGAATMAPSVGQLEMGFAGQGELALSDLMVSGLFRYGIGDAFEIRLDSGFPLDGSGVYLSPGIKWTAPSFAESLDVGLALHPILPIERNFGVFAMALASASVESFSVSLNAGGGIETGGAVEFVPQASLALGYQLGLFAPFLEAVAVLDDGFQSTLGLGVIWSNSQLAFDVAAYLDPTAFGEPEMAYQVLIGGTYRFKGE